MLHRHLSLDGIETGVRQLIREEPLETTRIDISGEPLVEALRPFDRLYPQENGESALLQLQIQLANPLPYDLEEMNLQEYKNLEPRWPDWQAVRQACRDCATLIFDRIIGQECLPL